MGINPGDEINEAAMKATRIFTEILEDAFSRDNPSDEELTGGLKAVSSFRMMAAKDIESTPGVDQKMKDMKSGAYSVLLSLDCYITALTKLKAERLAQGKG